MSGDKVPAAVEWRQFGQHMGKVRRGLDLSGLEDAQLLQRIAAGDEKALSVLYDRYARLVFSVALHITGHRHVAEDVTLETFMRVWQKAATYDGHRSQVRTWLTRMARHRAIDVLRREAVRPEKDSIAWAEAGREPASERGDVEVAAAVRLRQRQVRAAVAALPVEQQEALALAFFHGYSHQEIAQLLEQPLGTVKGRIRSGMQKLRFALRELR